MLSAIAFFLFTIIMWFAGNCILKLYHTAIQKGQILDQIFNWQNMLADLYASEKTWKNNLGKALGDCPTCFAFWFMPIWYVVYILLGKKLEIWLINGIGWNILWYIVFHSIGAVVGLSFLLTKKKDGL